MSKIQEGIYKAKISDAEWKPNSKGTGHYLKLHLTIIDNSDAYDKTVYDYLNFDNPSEIAERNALRTWISLCTAADLGNVNFDWKKGPDIETKRKIWNAELFIDIFHEPSDNGYVFYKIKKYISIKIPDKEYSSQAVSQPQQKTTDRDDQKDFSDFIDEIPF